MRGFNSSKATSRMFFFLSHQDSYKNKHVYFRGNHKEKNLNPSISLIWWIVTLLCKWLYKKSKCTCIVPTYMYNSYANGEVGAVKHV